MNKVVSTSILLLLVRAGSFLALYPATILFADHIGIESFGTWSQLVALVVMLFPFISGGVPQYLVINRATSDALDVPYLNFVSLLLVFTASFFLLALGFIWSGLSESVNRGLVISSLVIAACCALNLLRAENYRIQDRIFPCEILRALYLPGFQILVILTTLLAIKIDFTATFWLALVTYTIIFVAFELGFLRTYKLSTEFDWQRISKTVKVSFVAILPSLLLIVNQNLDIFVVEFYLGLESAGIYALYFRILGPLSLIVATVNSVQTYACSEAVRNRDGKRIAQMTRLASALAFLLTVLCSVLIVGAVYFFRGSVEMLSLIELDKLMPACGAIIIAGLMGQSMLIFQMIYGSKSLILMIIGLLILKYASWYLLFGDDWVMLFVLTFFIVFILKGLCYLIVRRAF